MRTREQSNEYTFTAPVSRFLGAADLARTSAFYGGLLAFEVGAREANARAVEVVSGKARLHFERRDSGSADPAVVFFETDNVERLHAAVRARGGAPSAFLDVNALHMRVFELRDPDGHVLWFGQRFDEPDERPPPGQLEKIMPELPLSDVAAGVAHYRDLLGFKVNYEQDDLGVLDRDGVRLLLVARTDRHKGIGSAYVYVRDADALHAELLGRGADVRGKPVSQPWGLREFRVFDVEGNQITFGQPFE